MNCQQATALFSAYIDHEITLEEQLPLEVHLGQCPACRAAVGALRAEDAELRLAFAPRRQAAAGLARKVTLQFRKSRSPLRASDWFVRWSATAAAVAAGVLVSWVSTADKSPRPPGGDSVAAAAKEERLTARAKPRAPASQVVAVGDRIDTKAGERRRVTLPDGSILYVNQNSKIHLDAEGRVNVRAGEVFVEVAHRPEGKPFVVETPDRAVTALGTKFAVKTAAAGTSVTVIQGKVKVAIDGREPSEDAPILLAGQHLDPAQDKPSDSPRASHLLAWTRDLVTAADAPLVPASQHAGGALVAKDADGREASLSLRKFHVDVHVEDGFARTTIDQTYFNHQYGRLEGTFYFPLPADASLSRLAMYVDGNLMEGGMVERDYGRNVFESIVTRQKDPALLEWVDGSTFKMRVFPLEGRQEKRIILSYSQRLESLYGQLAYRFPAGHSLEQVRDWSFHGRVKNGAAMAWSCDSHTLNHKLDGKDLLLDAEAKNVKIDKDVVLNLYDADPGDKPHFSTAIHEGQQYLMVRLRPTLQIGNRQSAIGNSPAIGHPRHWVVLFESSGNRDPLLARAQIEIVRTMLQNAEHEDTFSVLTAGTRVTSFRPEPQPVTPSNVAAAVEFLENAHLIGALDLGQALEAATSLVQGTPNPWLLHVGSGVPSLGERREDVLAKMVPDNVHYVGVGVGKRWSRGIMKAAADRTGGYFTQINPDEPIAWRAFELYSTLNTPRLLNVKVVDDAERVSFLTFASSVAQGEEVCAVARFDPKTQPLPESVTIAGRLDGQPFSRKVSVKEVAERADYLPRTWARLEIDRLLAENSAAHKDKIVALSKTMYVMTPFTSLLVLENEEMYKQYNVDRGRKDHWARYPCPQKIPVVYEPGQGQEVKGGRKTAEEVGKTVVVRGTSLHVAEPKTIWESTWEDVVHNDRRLQLDMGMPLGSSHSRLGFGPPILSKLPYINRLFRSSGYATEPEAFVDLKLLEIMRDEYKRRFEVRLELQKKAAGSDEEIREAQLGYLTIDSILKARRSDLQKAMGGYSTLANAQGAYVFSAAQARLIKEQINRERIENCRRVFDQWLYERATVPDARAKSFGNELSQNDRALFGDDTFFRATNSVQLNYAPVFVSPTMRWAVPNVSLDRGTDPQLALNYNVGRLKDISVAGAVNDSIWFDFDSDGRVEVLRGHRLARAMYTGLSVDFDRDEPPVQFPPAATWQALSKDRKAKYESSGLTENGGEVYFLSLGYYPPARGLVVKATSRIHTRLGGGLLGPRVVPPMAARSTESDFKRYAIDLSPADMNRVFRLESEKEWSERLRREAGFKVETVRQLVPSYALSDDGETVIVLAPPEDRPVTEQEKTKIQSLLKSRRSRRGGITSINKLINSVTETTPVELARLERLKLRKLQELLSEPSPFTDLVAFAPGMDTGLSDVEAILEAEVAPQVKAELGHIDPAARKLIEQARGGGWQALAVGGADDAGQFNLLFDAAGRFAWERKLPTGLVEKVLCDGPTLVHLYPELGIGARRAVSRYHRAEVLGAIPWLLPPVEELARGVDIRLIAERTISLSVRETASGGKKKQVQVHLLFAPEGRLAERRWVLMPEGKVLSRETYAADGTVRLLDGDGKELVTWRFPVKPAAAPDLKPELTKFVVLPLPYRSLEHVYADLRLAQQFNIDAPENGWVRHLDGEAKMRLFAAEFVAGNFVRAGQVYRTCFANLGDKRIGFAVLLAAAGATLGDRPGELNIWADHPNEAISNYFTLLKNPLYQSLQEMLGIYGAEKVLSGSGLLPRLAVLHDLGVRLRWARETASDVAAHDRKRLFEFVRANRDSLLGLAGLRMAAAQNDNGRAFQRSLADTWALYHDTGLDYLARYEQARALFKAGQRPEARNLFRELYADTLDLGVLPAIDADFRKAIQSDPDKNTAWADFLNGTTDVLIAEGRRPEAIGLAWQCRQLGDAKLADQLADRALERIESDWERLFTNLAGVRYQLAVGQPRRAEALVRELLERPAFAEQAGLWRLGFDLAEKTGAKERALACLEKALDLEYPRLPEQINLETIRRDYGRLFDLYETVAKEQRDLSRRVERFADRWRLLDTDSADPCQRAGRLLKRLGVGDLAWEYFTTPIGQRPNEAEPWLNLARAMQTDKDYAQADRAYREAFAAEPTNAQILWDQAALLRESGDKEKRAQVLRQIADGQWQSRFEGIKTQARQELNQP